MALKTFPITLEDVFWLTPKVKHFIFRCEQKTAFNYIPGQFITVHFEQEGKTLRRSYSIANTPQMNNLIEFAAGYVEGGPGTEFLFNLKPGDAINITGPFGRLILKEDLPKRYILVATSTGVTPYRAMLDELKQRLQKHPDLEVLIMQGVQRREDVLYKEEFSAFAQNHPQVQFFSHLSREAADTLLKNEYAGYVQHAFPKLSLNPENDRVYLCGNPGMIDESFAYLKEQGFDMKSIVREKYISGK